MNGLNFRFDWTVCAMIISATAVLMMAFVCGCVQPPAPAVPPVQFQAPEYEVNRSLTAQEYESLSGFDASTEQTLREQVRNNDLEWRVAKLEREVRRLNQSEFGVAELRIGDDGTSTPTEEEPQ